LYQEPNPGIVYRYRISGNTNLPRNNHFPHNAGIILLIFRKEIITKVLSFC